MNSIEKNYEIILCASGKSERFDSNKLLYRLNNGMTMLESTLTNITQKTQLQCTVVIPPAQPELLKIIKTHKCTPLVMEPKSNGLGETIAYAVNHLANCSGWMICLADMPFIQPETYSALANAAMANQGKIVAPQYDGKRGHPVWFANDYYRQLTALTGDKGAASIIKLNPDGVLYLPVGDPGIVDDIDTKAGAENLCERYREKQ